MATTTDRQPLAGRQRHMKVATHEPAPDYSSLVYDYSQIEVQHRQMVQDAALEIHKWQRNTIAVGVKLMAIKELLPHGQFEDWWQTEFALSERMVQSLLTVARVYGDPSNPRRVAGLSDGALYLLAAPSTPEAARAEVEELVEQGQVPTRAEVKAIIAVHRPPPKTINVTATPTIIPLDEVVIEDDRGAPWATDPTDEELAAMQEVAKEREAEEPLQGGPELLSSRIAKIATPMAEWSLEARDKERDELTLRGEAWTSETQPQDLFDAWLAQAPSEPDLRQCLAILELGKTSAKHARSMSPALYHATIDAVRSLSTLCIGIEKELKRS
jgi:hypothetical protein